MTGNDRLANARGLIGRPVGEASTPALVLDLPTMRRNIAEMARRMSGLPAALRPHAKIHKSPIIGEMQLEAGAIGLTTATVWEATAMIEAGISDVLVANQVVGARKVRELARLASIGRVLALVDDHSNVEQISSAARSAGSEVGI